VGGQFATRHRAESEVELTDRSGETVGWPRHGHEIRRWQQQGRAGTREDRTFSQVEVSLPPHIADLDVRVDNYVIAKMEAALREVGSLDSEHGADLEALGTLLLRTESVASSKIEHIEASVDDYARALHGVKTNSSAVSMAAATEALDSLVGSVDGGRDIELGAVLTAHRALMREDRQEQDYAGRVRTMQNWIGGSDHSPRNALYVPPPPETVNDYLTDLMRFANRDDLPVLTQAAIVHAQFESIHPFTDGNGRIGRALINTVLRRRGATSRVVVPLASALVAHPDRYFDLLGDYRAGDVRPIQDSFADSTRVAAAESRNTARRLVEIPDEWREMTGSVRGGSAASKMLAILPKHPVISADQACAALDSPTSSVYSALERLHDAGVLRPLTDRKRNQVWGAALILDELADLGTRIASAAR
jgi:Fic family protein